MRVSKHLSRVRVALAVAVGMASLLALPHAAFAAGKACDLLTPAEIGSALGQKVSAFTEGPPGMCRASATGLTVMLRLARRTGGAGVEEKGIAMVKQMGGQVDLKTFGPMTCSTVVPPANLVQAMGFNTTCSILKDGWLAAVEIDAKAQKDMLPIEKLRPLAEKMSPRF